MHINISSSPDPAGPLAQRAAEDVRSMFAARVGEQPDSHEVQNEQTVECTKALIQRLADDLASKGLQQPDVESIVGYVQDWIATYFGAFGLIAEQLMRTVIGRAYLDLHPDPADDDDPANERFAAEWETRAIEETYQMLIQQGRTLV